MKHIKLYEEFKAPNGNKEMGIKIIDNCIEGKYLIEEHDVNIERHPDNLFDYELFFTVNFYDGIVSKQQIEINVLVEYASKKKEFTPVHISVRQTNTEEEMREDDIITEIDAEDDDFHATHTDIIKWLDSIFDLKSLKIQRTKSILDDIMPSKFKFDIDPTNSN